MADQEGCDIASNEEILELASLARHVPRITMPLSAMIDSYGRQPELVNNRKLQAFFGFVKDSYPDDGYRAIQCEHLSRATLAVLLAAQTLSPEHKYLDFPFWAHSKFNIGAVLGLDKYAGETVLDLGAGPAHFGVVARHFGCFYHGIDVMQYHWTPTRRHLYDDLSAFFGIERITQTIMPFQPLRVPDRYRLVTCLMGNFCSYKPVGGAPRRAWGWREWVFLLDDLARNVATPEYNLYFHISRDYLPAEVTSNLRVFAKTFDETSCVFTFDQTLDLEALRRSVPEGP